jgi:hypothetical protein
MKEVCFCGSVDDLENREPVLDRDGEQALQCSGCGHLDYLRWLPNDIRLLVLEDEFDSGSDGYAGERIA